MGSHSVLFKASYHWKELQKPPSPRCAHVAGLIQNNSYKYICFYGGWDGIGNLFNDCIFFDLNKKEWIPITFSQFPGKNTQRFAHASCMLGQNELLVFGGVNLSCDFRDLVILSLNHCVLEKV